MKRTIILDYIDQCITEKIYKKVRELEKKLSPDRFTAYYSGGSILYWCVIFLGLSALTVLFYFIDMILFYIAGVGALGSLLVVIYHFTYRCTVDDVGMTIKKFFFFEKRVFWKDITKIRVRKHESYGKPMEKIAIMRNRQKKILYTCSYELVGFTLIVKKAREKIRQD